MSSRWQHFHTCITQSQVATLLSSRLISLPAACSSVVSLNHCSKCYSKWKIYFHSCGWFFTDLQLLHTVWRYVRFHRTIMNRNFAVVQETEIISPEKINGERVCFKDVCLCTFTLQFTLFRFGYTLHTRFLFSLKKKTSKEWPFNHKTLCL